MSGQIVLRKIKFLRRNYTKVVRKCLQAFSVKGPKDALSVVGTNGVEFAGTVTVTAQAIRPRNGARFLGFTVNGTDCPADRLSYEISGAEPEGIVEIVARYMPVGLNLFFR